MDTIDFIRYRQVAGKVRELGGAFYMEIFANYAGPGRTAGLGLFYR